MASDRNIRQVTLTAGLPACPTCERPPRPRLLHTLSQSYLAYIPTIKITTPPTSTPSLCSPILTYLLLSHRLLNLLLSLALIYLLILDTAFYCSLHLPSTLAAAPHTFTCPCITLYPSHSHTHPPTHRSHPQVNPTALTLTSQNTHTHKCNTSGCEGERLCECRGLV